VNQFGAKTILWSIQDTLLPGDDIRIRIAEIVTRAKAIFLFIGNQWLAEPWLQDPNDPDRNILAFALRHKKPIIPIVTSSSTLPDSSQLPRQLAQLIERGTVNLTLENFNATCDRLTAILIDKFGLQPVASQPTSGNSARSNTIPMPEFIDRLTRQTVDNYGVYRTIATIAACISAILAYITASQAIDSVRQGMLRFDAQQDIFLAVFSAAIGYYWIGYGINLAFPSISQQRIFSLIGGICFLAFIGRIVSSNEWIVKILFSGLSAGWITYTFSKSSTISGELRIVQKETVQSLFLTLFVGTILLDLLLSEVLYPARSYREFLQTTKDFKFVSVLGGIIGSYFYIGALFYHLQDAQRQQIEDDTVTT
jgi:hypothetical protein